jgi:hypothetical protein
VSEHKVSEYRVYPTGYDEATFTDKYIWTITVAERDTGRWAVKGMFGVLNTDGEWEYEPSPSNRDDDFLARCRFTEAEALRRALDVVDTVRINGLTIAEADAEVAARVADWEAQNAEQEAIK